MERSPVFLVSRRDKIYEIDLTGTNTQTVIELLKTDSAKFEKFGKVP